MSHHVRLLGAVLLVLAPCLAPAQTQPLMLGDLYREADAVSPRVAAARALARAAEARVPSTRRPPDPELQLGFMNRQLPGLAPMEPLGMTQLQVMQMVPVAGKLRLAGAAADARAAAQTDRAADVAWTVRADIAMVFYDLYGVDQSLAIMRRTLRLLASTRETAESMYRVGEGRQADVLRASVELARMEQDTLRMSAMRTAMAARLNALLDRTSDVPVATPELPRFPDVVPSLDTLLRHAALTRPMLLAGARDVEAANKDLQLARREIWPDLTIGVQVGQSRLTMPTEEGMPAERRTERMASLMIGASLPIFARSRQRQMGEEMSAMQRMAEAELIAMRAETRSEVARAHADLVRARSLAAHYRGTVLPQAEAMVQSAHSAYRTGGVDFMTLLDGRMAVNTYQQELQKLGAEEGKAWAELEMLLGRELFDPDTRSLAGREPAGGAR